MGFFKSLGKVFLGSEPKSENQQLSTLTPEQQQFYNQNLLPFLTGRGFDAQMSPLEQASQQAIQAIVGQYANEGAPQTGLPNTYGATEQALTNALFQSPQDFNQFFDAAVLDPMLRSFQEKVLPSITRRHSLTPFGGQRAAAESDASENLINALSQQRAQLGYQAFENAANRRNQALSVAPAIQQIPLQQFQLNTAASQNILPQLVQALGAGGIQADRQAQYVMDALNAVRTPAIENVVTTKGGTQGLLPSLISAGSKLGSAAITGRG